MTSKSPVSPLRLALGLTLSAWVATAQASDVCALAGVRAGLTSFHIEGAPAGDFGRRIPGVNVDGDSIEDELVWFCGGSGSIIPADPCTLTLTLSSSKKTFELKQDRLHVVKVDGRLYVQTGWRKHESDPQRSDIYRIDRVGFVPVCSFVEGPNKSLERVRGK
jgi:hypothetical protein